MNRKKYEAYEEQMNSITDPEALKRAMQTNEYELRRKAVRPIWGGFSGSVASIMLFILTGILSGWTVGVLWVVGSIMGAGILGSCVTAAVARRKYGVFTRAMRNRDKLKAMIEDGKDHTAFERARVEHRLQSDLKWLQKHRLISTREQEIYSSVMRPVIARGGTESDARREEIRNHAMACNHTMENIATEVRDLINTEVANNSDKWNSKGDNIDSSRTFEGYLKISNQSRNTVTGEGKTDSEGKPLFDQQVRLSANSDKDLALLLIGLSNSLKQHSADKNLSFPLKIEAFGYGGVEITEWGEGGLVLTSPRGTILTEGENVLEQLAKEIFDKLPEAEPVREESEEHTHEGETHEGDEHEEETSEDREAGDGRSAEGESAERC